MDKEDGDEAALLLKLTPKLLFFILSSHFHHQIDLWPHCSVESTERPAFAFPLPGEFLHERLVSFNYLLLFLCSLSSMT